MKNKRLIVLISIFCFVVLVVVLGSTVFTVQKISFNWLSSTNKLNEEFDYSAGVDMPMGNSVFFVNKEEIIKNVEKANPYLQVVSVETSFPNRLTLHVAERESLFAIQLQTGDYVVLDKEMKVLEFMDKVTYLGLNKTQKPILVDLSETSYVFNSEDFVLGEKFKYENLTKVLEKLAYSFLSINYTPFTAKGIFESISIKIKLSEVISLSTRYGLEIEINDAENLLTEKLNFGIACYNDIHDKGETEGTISVYYSEKNNKIQASYS